MRTLAVFSNFRINDEERFKRMKDSFLSFKDISAVKWVVNIRGIYKNEALSFLETHLNSKLVYFELDSADGWFHDSRLMMDDINTDYVLYWIEDHINLMKNLSMFDEILNEMNQVQAEFLSYSFHWANKKYALIHKKKSKNINSFNLTIANFNLVKEVDSSFYILWSTGIFSTHLFKRIIIDDDIQQAIKWPKEVPFDFEKSSYDTHWLPIKMAFPKEELFVSIDDDHLEPGSSLISRGLYPSRIIRKHGLGPLGYAPIKYPNLKTYVHRIEEHNTKAAIEIVPALIGNFKPESVIDVGCGTGSWLKVFEENGIENIIGIDGSYVNKDMIQIPLNKFIESNLEEPLIINKKFDLLLCLEVAEHLKPSRAESFIKELTMISDTIIFSAAIPGQGGQNHLNEQYPDYWINIFNMNNFEGFDFIRSDFWNNNNIDWWYRQNILVFKKNNESNSIMKNTINALITKELYERKLEEISLVQKELLLVKEGEKQFKFYLKAVIKRALRRLK